MRKLFLFLLLIPYLAAGQIPTSYGADQQLEIALEVQRLKQQYDVVIPIEERMPLLPSARSLATGNWGYVWTGIGDHYSEIQKDGTRKVAVFILDTAPAIYHPFLATSIWNEKGKSFASPPETVDGNGHGTHCAGIVGALSSQYKIGLASPMSELSLLRIIPVQVLNSRGSGSYSWIEAGVKYATQTAKELQAEGYFCIISMSLGGPGSNAGLDAALKEAREAGILIFAATGNTYGEGLEYPGRSSWTNGIGAIGSNGQKAGFSTWGEGIFSVSPGVGILSTYIGTDDPVELSGTSMATPGTAALAAIAASVHPTADADQVELILQETATDILDEGYDLQTGYGYNHVRKILAYELPGDPDPDPDPGPDPEPDPEQSKGKRIVTAVLPGPFGFVYQPGQGKFVDAKVCNLQVNFKTKLYSEDALLDILPKIEGYFENRALVLTDKGDALRAGYWAGRFLEIHLKKEYGIRSSVRVGCVEDDNGNQGLAELPGFLDYFRASRRSTFRYQP